jgi:serine/threonine protein kinase/tetratricopeptide (TPR) repeat protein
MLGAGGMGVVYKAQDMRLERLVALKFLPADLTKDGNALERFRREARSASALNHPHICTIHDVGEHEGRPFIAMELLEGETLKQRLAGRSLTVDEIIDLGIQIADALEAAHGKGILHRDIKPANIFITDQGWVKVLDFGLAKTAPAPVAASGLTVASDSNDHLTGPGTTLGTVVYMSPEQARGEPLDARTDLFSFGAVLYEMATGRQAFAGQTTALIFRAVLDQQPPSLAQLHPEIPAALDRIVTKALEKDRGMRYLSAADVRGDLKRLKRDRESGETSSSSHAATRQPRTRKGIHSLAVLPLVNGSGDQDAEYLCEGIAESLLNSFSRLPKLRVVPQQKSFRYTGPDVDIHVVARDLNVQSVLTGKVLVRGDTLVVKMALDDVARDARVWGQQFTKKMSDIFVLQDEIADEVLQALKLKLVAEPKKRAPRATHSSDAYHLYLKGRFCWSRRTPDNTRRALEFYQQAIENDPDFALAYAGIADCYAHLGFTPYGTMRPAEAYPRAKAAAEKALALDPSLGEAYASLGLSAFLYDWDWAAAERAFRRSLELAPESMGARLWYPFLLVDIGRGDEAIREARRAAEIDPLSANAATVLGQVLYCARHYDEAIPALRRALDIQPYFPTAHLFLGLAYLTKGLVAEAVACAETAATIHPHPMFLGYKAVFYVQAGRRDDAMRILEELTDLARRSYVSPYPFAIVHQALRDWEPWKKMMQASLEERAAILVTLNMPWNDDVRLDPFFQAIVRQVGLPSV